MDSIITFCIKHWDISILFGMFIIWFLFTKVNFRSKRDITSKHWFDK